MPEDVKRKTPTPRVEPGASATLGNVGPQRRGAPDPEEADTPQGTTSGHGTGGKPSRGHRDRDGY